MPMGRRIRGRGCDRWATAFRAVCCILSFVLVVVLVPIAGVGVASGFDEKRQAEVVQQDVTALLKAMYGGDVATQLRYAYPLVVLAMGGPDKARASLVQAGEQLKDAGTKVELLDFPEPPRFVAGSAGRQFAVVPTRTILSVRGQRVQSFNFQLGVLEVGASQWFYLEGSRMTPPVLAGMFPDFPTAYRFPKVSKEVL